MDTLNRFIFLDSQKENPIVEVNELKGSKVFKEYLQTAKKDYKAEWFINGREFKTFPYCGWKYVFTRIKEKIKQRFSP